jgi:predicted DCC family thiol-disulfide oxidoreductase YuxK
MTEMKSKIFFDGNCIVCDTEVAHYKRIAPNLFEMFDISSPSFDAKQFGLTVEAVNKNMHVLTPEGEIKIGVDAFAHIWSRIDKYKFASKLIQMPVVKSLAKVGYRVFAEIRFLLPKKKR